MNNGRAKDIFSTHDAAKVCRVTPMTVIRWIKEGKIPAFKTAGGHRRILRVDLEKFCRTRGIPFAPDEADARGKILVVDADPSTRDAVAEAARSCDETLTIEQAADAFTAGRMVATFRPSLMFLDQRLPGIDALELVARLARDPDMAALSIVVMCTLANADLERAFRARGATALIRKPPAPQVIDRLVRTTFQLGPEETDDGDVTPLSIVIVDGDSRACKQVKKDIEEGSPGARVLIFDTCIDALLAIGADRPDYMILDVGRDDMDCVEMVRRVHAQKASGAKPIEIIAIADPSKESLRQPITAAGARDFMLKPLSSSELLERMGPRAQVAVKKR